MIYRPPNSDTSPFLESLSILTYISEKPKQPFYSIGYLNLNLLSCHTKGCTDDTVSLMQFHTYAPLTTKPTQVTRLAAALIDHFGQMTRLTTERIAELTQP